MSSITPAEARRQIMRWQQNLRFGKSEEELKLKATNLKIVTDNEDQGCLVMSIGADPAHEFKFFCSGTMMVQSDDYDLMSWCMMVNDKLERKMEDPRFDATGAVRELCLAYIKEKKIQAVHVNDEPDEPTSMDYTPTVADISHEELSGFVTPESRVAHRDRMTPAQRVAVMLEEDLRAAQTPQMRESGVFVRASHGDPLTWNVSMFNFPSSSVIGHDLQDYAEVTGISDVLVELHFSENHPIDPPVARMIRPRIAADTGNVQPGGTIACEQLSRHRWIPGFRIADVLQAVRDTLISSNASIDSRVKIPYPSYEQLNSAPVERPGKREVVATLKALSPMAAQVPEIEVGNTIMLPLSIVKELNEKGVEWPYYFRIGGPKSTIRSVCAVPKFDAPEGIVVIPTWLMGNLGIEPMSSVLVANRLAPMGKFVQFRPQSVDFGRDLDNLGQSAVSVIGSALGNFFTLTVGDVLPISVFGATYWLEVTQCEPARTICIHPTSADETLNLNMDMLPFEPGLTERVPFADSGAVGVGSFTPWSGGKGPSLPSTPATQGTPQPARPQPPATTPAYKPVAPAPPKPIPPPLVDDFPDEFICAHCGQSVSVYAFDEHEQRCQPKGRR